MMDLKKRNLVESSKGMATVPDYIRENLSSVPAQWDDTCFIDAFPEKIMVMAPKSGNLWYVARLNGEANLREISFTCLL